MFTCSHMICCLLFVIYVFFVVVFMNCVVCMSLFVSCAFLIQNLSIPQETRTPELFFCRNLLRGTNFVPMSSKKLVPKFKSLTHFIVSH